MTPDEFSEYGRVIGENIKLRDALTNARSNLYAVVRQLSPRDDKIIADRIEKTYKQICDSLKDISK